MLCLGSDSLTVSVQFGLQFADSRFGRLSMGLQTCFQLADARSRSIALGARLLLCILHLGRGSPTVGVQFGFQLANSRLGGLSICLQALF